MRYCWSAAIRRPYNARPPTRDEGARVNGDIGASSVRLIDASGHNIGVVPTKLALDQAREAGLDLVEVASDASPPVCRLLDYGKHKYRVQKKASENRKRQKSVDLKEIKLRPNINVHDYEVKLRSVRRFIDDGDKVKITLRFRGRELSHQDLGLDLMRRVCDSVEPFARVETPPKVEGRQMVMALAPR